MFHLFNMVKCSSMLKISSFILLIIGVMAMFEETTAKRKGMNSSKIPDYRIIGGSITQAAKVPYYVHIHRFYTIAHIPHGRCGGSIISANWVLTVAHCVVDSYMKPAAASAFTLFAAKDSLHDKSVQMREVDYYVIHEYWSNPKKIGDEPPPVPYDIAVLKTTKAWKFTNEVSPISLIPMNYELPDGTVALTCGFGVDESGQGSEHLKALRLRKIFCEKSSPADTVICFTGFRPNQVVGQGDSGGPLVFSNGTTPVLIGLTCSADGDDAQFTDLSLFRDWIREITGI